MFSTIVIIILLVLLVCIAVQLLAADRKNKTLQFQLNDALKLQQHLQTRRNELEARLMGLAENILSLTKTLGAFHEKNEDLAMQGNDLRAELAASRKFGRIVWRVNTRRQFGSANRYGCIAGINAVGQVEHLMFTPDTHDSMVKLAASNREDWPE